MGRRHRRRHDRDDEPDLSAGLGGPEGARGGLATGGASTTRRIVPAGFPGGARSPRLGTMTEGGTAGPAVRMWARSELGRRWKALVALGIIAGIAAGLALAAVAGARRTSTAYARWRKATL